jgi:hypothetical protein
VSVNGVLPGEAKSQARSMADLLAMRMQNDLGKKCSQANSPVDRLVNLKRE